MDYPLKSFKVKTGNVYDRFSKFVNLSAISKNLMFLKLGQWLLLCLWIFKIIPIKKKILFFCYTFPKKKRHQINFCQKVWQNMRLNRISDRSFWLEIQIIEFYHENWTKKKSTDCSLNNCTFCCGQMKLWIEENESLPSIAIFLF